MAALSEIENEIVSLTKRHADLDGKLVKSGVVDLSISGAMNAVNKNIRELERRRTALLAGEPDPGEAVKASSAPPQLRPPRWVTKKGIRATADEVHAKNVEIARSLPLETPADDLASLYETEAYVAVFERALRGCADEIVENGRACEFSENLYAAILSMLCIESATTAAAFQWAGNQRKLLAQRVEVLESRRQDPLSSVQLQHIEHKLTPLFQVEFANAIKPLIERIGALEEQRDAMKYLGVWESGKEYSPGNFVTDKGSVWHCHAKTRQRPMAATTGRWPSNAGLMGRILNMARSGNTTTLANATVNAEANALAALLDGGSIDILSGPQPDAADLPITSQTVGVTLTFSDPAFRPAVAGVIVSNLIQPGLAVAGIKPAWARMYSADHRAVMDISVGVRDANLIVLAEYLEKGMTVSCDSYTHTIAKKLT